jgi:hypothetical protein
MTTREESPIANLLTRLGCECDDGEYHAAGEHECLPGRAEAEYHEVIEALNAALERAERAERSRTQLRAKVVRRDGTIAKLHDVIEGLNGRVERLQADATHWQAEARGLTRTVAELEAEVNRLRKLLRCERSGNPCGTDTVVVDPAGPRHCQCPTCVVFFGGGILRPEKGGE